jgi:hypothetical protein
MILGTQIWKRTTQESFQQSLVEIGSVVSEEKFFLISSPLFSIFSLAAILAGSRDHRTQFLYKHNDELFNIYYGIMNFELLPILTDYAN